MPDPSYVNTCCSLVSPDYGISVAAVYRYSEDKGIYKVKDSGGVSPEDADLAFRKQETRYASGWYDSITSDSFGQPGGFRLKPRNWFEQLDHER